MPIIIQNQRQFPTVSKITPNKEVNELYPNNDIGSVYTHYDKSLGYNVPTENKLRSDDDNEES